MKKLILGLILISACKINSTATFMRYYNSGRGVAWSDGPNCPTDKSQCPDLCKYAIICDCLAKCP